MVPKEIKAADGNLTILWSDGHASRYDCRSIRLACRCAACVEEWTHKTLIQKDRIPAVIKPTQIEPVGHYALQFVWSDGHNTGIYPYEDLRKLCECEECKKQREFAV